MCLGHPFFWKVTKLQHVFLQGLTKNKSDTNKQVLSQIKDATPIWNKFRFFWGVSEILSIPSKNKTLNSLPNDIYIYIKQKIPPPPPKKSYDFATRKSTLLKQLLLFFPQITLTTTGTGRMGGSVAGPRPSGLALYLSPWSLWSPDGHPWESFSRREFRWVFGWNGLGWDTVGVGGHLKILTFWSLKHFEPQRNGGFWTDDFFLWKLGDVFFFWIWCGLGGDSDF